MFEQIAHANNLVAASNRTFDFQAQVNIFNGRVQSVQFHFVFVVAFVGAVIIGLQPEGDAVVAVNVLALGAHLRVRRYVRADDADELVKVLVAESVGSNPLCFHFCH